MANIPFFAALRPRLKSSSVSVRQLRAYSNRIVLAEVTIDLPVVAEVVDGEALTLRGRSHDALYLLEGARGRLLCAARAVADEEVVVAVESPAADAHPLQASLDGAVRPLAGGDEIVVVGYLAGLNRRAVVAGLNVERAAAVGSQEVGEDRVVRVRARSDTLELVARELRL